MQDDILFDSLTVRGKYVNLCQNACSSQQIWESMLQIKREWEESIIWSMSWDSLSARTPELEVRSLEECLVERENEHQ